MIVSSLFPPGNDDGCILDLNATTTRQGEGRLDHIVTLEARLNGTPQWSKRITFQVDAPFDVPDLPVLDPFVVAALFPAMETGGLLRVHGSVSRTLIRNVLDFNAAWHTAAPHICKLFSLECTSIDDGSALKAGSATRAVLAFTGGVDSLLALCRNASGDAGPIGQDIGATMMIHGKGIGVGMGDGSAELIADLRRISARWNVPMAVVNTNIAEVVDKGGMSHGTWIASCLSLFSQRFAVGVIGSSKLWYSPGWEIYGSHPLLDPLLSGAYQAVREDGALYHRCDKLSLLRRYPSALDDLRVCFHPYRVKQNCCRCEKCIRTMLCLIACGIPISKAFPEGLRLKDIGIGMGNRAGFQWVPGILESAKRNGTDREPAIRILRARYRRKRLKVGAKRWLRWLHTGSRPPHWYVLEDI